jgi:two-component system nitrate/nitrite response regulator NarL
VNNKKRCPRVLVVDDFPEILKRVRELLRDHCEVIGSVANGQEALLTTLTLNPDILVVDISMPILNGFEVARRVRESNCSAKIVFFTMHEDRDYVDAAFSCGASGYVLKSRASTDLLPAIEAALQHHTFTSPFQAYTGVT